MGANQEASQIEKLKQEDQVGVPQQDEYAPADIQKEVHILEDPEWIAKQKNYLRKLDLILMPTISILYFFEYLDRGNIAVRRTLPFPCTTNPKS